MNHLLNWSQVSSRAWNELLARSIFWSNADVLLGEAGAGKSIALLFFNDSLRTRISMELAASQLGAFSSTIMPGSGTWGFSFDDGEAMLGDSAEHIQEAIGVISTMFDAIGVRLFASGTDYEADKSERLMKRIFEAATVPVINLESAFYHPCQSLADATVLSNKFSGDPSGKKFVLSWAYHPKALPMAVPNSTLLMAARLGMDITIAHPDGYELDADVMAEARQLSGSHGQTIDVTSSLDEASNGAHVIYAKSWGGRQAYDFPDREKTLRESNQNWRITERQMDSTDNGSFMHCLPVRRNVVVEDAVLDSPRALHLKQARARLSAQKAILERVWAKPGVET